MFSLCVSIRQRSLTLVPQCPPYSAKGRAIQVMRWPEWATKNRDYPIRCRLAYASNFITTSAKSATNFARRSRPSTANFTSSPMKPGRKNASGTTSTNCDAILRRRCSARTMSIMRATEIRNNAASVEEQRSSHISTRSVRQSRYGCCFGVARNVDRKDKDNDDTAPSPALARQERSPGWTDPPRPADTYLCPVCRAGGECALFLHRGPPTDAVPPLTPRALATVAQLRVVGAAQGGGAGRPLGAEFPLGQRSGGRGLYSPWDPSPMGRLKCPNHPRKDEPA